MVRSSERSGGDRGVSTTASPRFRPSVWRGLGGAGPSSEGGAVLSPPVVGRSPDRGEGLARCPHTSTLDRAHYYPLDFGSLTLVYPTSTLDARQTIPWTLALSRSLLSCLSHLGWRSHHFKRVTVTPSIYPGSQGCCWTRQTIPWTLAPSHSCLSCLSHTLAPGQCCFRSVMISASQLYRWREFGVGVVTG